MNPNHSTRDVTAQQPIPGPGMSHDKLWMCGHRGTSAGALYKRIPGRQPIAWRCAACNKDKP